ncbi:MAG: hypothetical protein HUJ29_10770 [Gammaproteobacteria bacterium]|nr:hypothetical protein [Gammaproteobacteria bacterium]
MKVKKITTLQSYQDWLEKAKYEFELYKSKYGVYELSNCFLTLNALPDWIDKSDLAPQNLKSIAAEKIKIMKGDDNKFQLDETKLDEINHQLRLIRLFCNHAKHGDKKEKLEAITMSAVFPMTFPIKFDHLKIGSENVNVVPVIESVISFWERVINNA